MNNKRVLVAGATGYVGGYIVNELLQHQYFVKAITRNKSKLQQLHTGIDEIIEAEITNPTTLEGCCNNTDVVITTIGITRQKDKLTYMDVDYQGNLNLLKEALKSGVQRFIYIYIFNAEKINHLKIVQAKQKFASALKQSSLNYCLVNPTGFFADMHEYIKMAKKGTAYVFGNGDCKINPIHGSDLATVCVRAIETNEHEINIGGPEIFTHRQIASMAFSILNKPANIKHIPFWLQHIIIKLLKIFTRVYTYGPIEFLSTVLTTNMVAPQFGNKKLDDYFKNESK